MPEPTRLVITRREVRVGEAEDHCFSVHACCTCGHRGKVDMRLLSERWGRSASMRKLSSLCRCTRCDIRVSYFSYEFKDYVVLR